MITGRRLSNVEMSFIDAIVQRWRDLFFRATGESIAADTWDHLAAAHRHRPLRLADLVAAPDFTFAREMAGIHNNFCRQRRCYRHGYRPLYLTDA